MNAGISRLLTVLGAAALVAAADAAGDPAARALQQHQLQRQQQQDQLQLRMQQQQQSAQGSPADPRQQQATDQLIIDQQLRQQQLHYRQAVEAGGVQPPEDEASRRARSQRELQKAQQESRQQLRRFESELQRKPAADPLQPRKLE